MRFVCDSCRAQYMISDEKVGPKGVKVRCKKCSYVILVKKSDGAAKAPVSPVGADADDALATQVMQNPLTQGSPAETALDGTNPGFGEEKTQAASGGAPGPGGFFSGVDEDEIGAVFDQVLNSGPHALPKEGAPASSPPRANGGPSALGGDADDRLSTKVLDAAVMNQLAKESGGSEGPISGEASDAKPAAGGEAAAEWFAAIDDKQTGPLSVEKLKEHWARGEIGPDSLAWKAGMPDWIPISEIGELAGELAPRASKPVLVPPTPAVSAPSPVVSMPVESAFSAGAGLAMSARGEMQVPLGTGEEVASWRPSAASALASLVKEEMDALAKPSAPQARAEAALAGGGLLDLPSAPESAPAPRTNGHSEAQVPAASSSSRAPANPYLSTPAATYSSPAIAQYRPQQPAGKNPVMLAIIGVGGVLVVMLGFLIFRLAQPPPAPVVITQAAPAPAVAPPAPAVAPAPAQPAPAAAAPAAAGTPAPADQVPAPAAAAPSPAVAPTPVAPRPTGTGSFKSDRKASPKAEPSESSKPAIEPPSSGKRGKEEKDDFDDVFGSGDSKPAAKKPPPEKEAQTEPKRSATYIPPAPGSGNAPETLSQSDIMEVVLANKSALAACASEQKKKEPGVSGKLSMKWTIQPSGRTSNVSCVSDEFKSTYMAQCVGGLIKGWTFPKHKKQGDPVVFPFKF